MSETPTKKKGSPASTPSKGAPIEKTDKSPPAPRSKHDVILPMTKVKQVMKSSPEIANINTEAGFLMTKATELMIEHLSKSSWGVASKAGAKSFEYKYLAEYVQKNEKLDFLNDCIPRKMTAKAALELVKKQNEINRRDIC